MIFQEENLINDSPHSSGTGKIDIAFLASDSELFSEVVRIHLPYFLVYFPTFYHFKPLLLMLWNIQHVFKISESWTKKIFQEMGGRDECFIFCHSDILLTLFLWSWC